jgi:hypothetical protein
MATVTPNDRVNIVRGLLDAYGIGVRAGVITPCSEDEQAFRAMLRLPDLPSSVVKEWKRTDGVRLPITLQRGLSEPDTSVTPSGKE